MVKGMSTRLFDELKGLVADDEARAEYRHELAMSAFTNGLARIMTDQRVSQAELARRLGVSRARVSQIMQHRCSPTLRTMIQLTGALGCELSVVIAPHANPGEDGDLMPPQAPLPPRAQAVSLGQVAQKDTAGAAKYRPPVASQTLP